MKRLLALALAVTLLLALGAGTLSGASDEQEITVLLNGKKIEFDVAPVIENGRTLVPLRAIFEELDMEVTYDNGVITAEKEGLEIDLSVDSDIAYVGGEQKTLDVPSRIVDGRTLVPLRFVGESTGLTVDYNGETRIVTMNDLPNMTLEPKNHDLKSDWDDATATKINLSGNSATVEGSGATVSGGIITISAEGTYVVSGTLTDGQIIVDVTNEDRIHLILSGADITNQTGAAIHAPQCDKVVLTLADGSNNTVTDGGSNFAYTLVDSEEPNAAVFVKDDLTINGTGTLTVNAGFNNGIGTKDDLLIVSGNLIINAVNHGIRGNDSVGIMDGTFNITAGNDGIKTSNDKNENKGWVIIQGGTFDIKSQDDGIQAANTLTITGGVFNIMTGGGSANAPARIEERPSGGGMGNRQQNQASNQAQTPVITTGEETASMKALKAEKQLNITGGDFTIDAEDDGIHSNNNIFISGGKFSIETGDDGIHADNAVVISGGEINIPVCYEGIEGLSVTISGGDIKIIASDDAINAAGGESTGHGAMRDGGQIGMPQNGMDMETTQKAMEIIRAAGTNELTEEQLQALYDLGLTDEQITQMKSMAQGGGRGGMGGGQRPSMTQGEGQQGERSSMPQDGQQGMPGGGMSEPRFAVTDGAFIRISGGTLDLWGRTDGIDSNGHVYLEGGTVRINGQSSGAEGALEMDGDFIVTGGELITAGSVYTPSSSSTQPMILLSYTSGQTVGSVITIKDSTGNILLEYTSKVAFTASGFTSPSFKIGETYSVFVNGEKRIDITLSGLTTSIGDDGGAYSTGRSGGMGGRGGIGGGQPATNIQPGDVPEQR